MSVNVKPLNIVIIVISLNLMSMSDGNKVTTMLLAYLVLGGEM